MTGLREGRDDEYGGAHALLLLCLNTGNYRSSCGHGVRAEEFEEVVSAPDFQDVSRSTGNLLAMGSTSEGRRLCCVYKRFDRDVVEPVTAYEVGD